MVDTVTTTNSCEGTLSFAHTEQHGEMVGYLQLAGGLVMLTEDPNNPGHFTGSANPIHEETPQTGGMSILDITVEWDLTRTPRP